jgi:hypothetical protein
MKSYITRFSYFCLHALSPPRVPAALAAAIHYRRLTTSVHPNNTRTTVGAAKERTSARVCRRVDLARDHRLVGTQPLQSCHSTRRSRRTRMSTIPRTTVSSSNSHCTINISISITCLRRPLTARSTGRNLRSTRRRRIRLRIMRRIRRLITSTITTNTTISTTRNTTTRPLITLPLRTSRTTVTKLRDREMARACLPTATRDPARGILAHDLALARIPALVRVHALIRAAPPPRLRRVEITTSMLRPHRPMPRRRRRRRPILTILTRRSRNHRRRRISTLLRLTTPHTNIRARTSIRTTHSMRTPLPPRARITPRMLRPLLPWSPRPFTTCAHEPPRRRRLPPPPRRLVLVLNRQPRPLPSRHRRRLRPRQAVAVAAPSSTGPAITAVPAMRTAAATAVGRPSPIRAPRAGRSP